MKSIILGSASKWRKQILEDSGYSFDVMVADIDEKAIRLDDYEKLPLLIARAKAEAILPRISKPSILIVSDQVVVCDGELREKPQDEQEAIRFMESYSEGKPAQTNTAVMVVNTQNGKKGEGVDIAKAFFKKIPTPTIEKFVHESLALTCAGGFIINHPLLVAYLEKIEGDEDSIQGLPMRLVEKLMKEVA